MRASANMMARRARSAQKADEVMKLVLRGVNYSDAARHVGVTKQHAITLAKRALASIVDRATAAELLHRENLRLDHLQSVASRHLGSENAETSLKAISESLKVIEMRARLNGLFAPTKQQITGADGGPVQVLAGAIPLSEIVQVARANEADPTPALTAPLDSQADAGG